MADTRRVFQDARTFKGLSAALIFLPLTLFEEIDNKVRWASELLIVSGIALLVVARIHLSDQPVDDTSFWIEVYGNMHTDIQAWGGKPLMIDAESEVRKGGRLADIEFIHHDQEPGVCSLFKGSRK